MWPRVFLPPTLQPRECSSLVILHWIISLQYVPQVADLLSGKLSQSVHLVLCTYLDWLPIIPWKFLNISWMLSPLCDLSLHPHFILFSVYPICYHGLWSCKTGLLCLPVRWLSCTESASSQNIFLPGPITCSWEIIKMKETHRPMFKSVMHQNVLFSLQAG